MSDETSSASPPLIADPQDPLPESNWLWRRILAFAIVGVIGWQQVMAGNRIARWGDSGSPKEAIDALLNMTHWHMGVLGGILLLYMVAPSAEQVAKILATLSAWKSGISTAVMSKVDTTKGTAETKTVTGPAVAPAAAAGDLPEYARP